MHERVKIGRKTTLRLRGRVSQEEGIRLFVQARAALSTDPPDTEQARSCLEQMRVGMGPDFPPDARDMLAEIVRRDAKLGWRALEQRMAEKNGAKVTQDDVELMKKAVDDMDEASVLGCNETREQLPMARQLFTQIRLAAENGWEIEWEAKTFAEEVDPPPMRLAPPAPKRRMAPWIVVSSVET